MTTSLISIKLTTIESEFIPDNGVYVMEQYLDDFYVISCKAISQQTALMAVAKYLTMQEADGKERPKYRNLQEKLLADYKSIWEREYEEIEWKRNFTNGFPFSMSPYRRASRSPQQPDESTKPQDSSIQDSE